MEKPASRQIRPENSLFSDVTLLLSSFSRSKIRFSGHRARSRASVRYSVGSVRWLSDAEPWWKISPDGSRITCVNSNPPNHRNLEALVRCISAFLPIRLALNVSGVSKLEAIIRVQLLRITERSSGTCRYGGRTKLAV
ncbi:hypothetical protein DY000_02048821 [Brassica cretica]|uniref:Uncharacterized protein n=1 Tax=Brassica cretica TaxID=69181 RepID=A0ABQ7F840_BRACR|nr:hypothetical protein DY000_02048821 [Brassica cretica]